VTDTAKLLAGVSLAEVHDLIGKMRQIPDEHRTFGSTELDAWRQYDMKRSVLSYMVAHDMPSRRTAEGALRFDEIDLRNAYLHLRTSATARATRRFWAAALCRDTSLGPARYEVTVLAGCPDPGHSGACRFQVLLPDGESTVERRTPGPAIAPVGRIEMTVPVDWPELPAVARDWVEETTAGLSLMLLPGSLYTDVAFMRRTGLADCTGSAQLLLREGQRRGLSVRPAAGFILGSVYSTGHQWVELRIDDRWVPLDPLLIRHVGRWGVLPGGAWPVWRSPGSLLGRIGAVQRPLVLHNGVPAPHRLATRVLDAETE
jgi:hypothetical protein